MRSAAVAVACSLAVASASPSSSPTPAVAAGGHTSDHRAAPAATTARGDRLAIDNGNLLDSHCWHQRRPPLQQHQQQRGSRRCLGYRSRYSYTAVAAASRRGSGLGPVSCFLAPPGRYSGSDGRRGEQQQQQQSMRNTPPSARRGR